MGDKAISGANGKHGRVIFFNSDAGGPIEFCVEEWNLTETAREEEITNSCSQGKEEYEYGTKHCEISLAFTIDLSQHPFDDPPDIRVGESLFPNRPGPSYLFLHEHEDAPAVNTSGAWQFTGASVISCSVSCPAIGKVRYELNLKSVGLYYRPYELTASGA